MYLICVFYMLLCSLITRFLQSTHLTTTCMYTHLMIPVYSLMLLLILLHQDCPTHGPSDCCMRSAVTFVSIWSTITRYCYTLLYFFQWHNSLYWVMPHHYRGFMNTFRHLTFVRTPLDDWLARRTDHYLTTHSIHKKQVIRATGRVRTRNPSKQAAADLLLRTRGITIIRHNVTSTIVLSLSLSVYIYNIRTYIQWTLELRPSWHTKNLGYDQNFSFYFDRSLELRPECRSRPKRVSACAVVNKDLRCVRKRQSEPRYACLWT
jgi:hypothetical protein